jgi:hypothetical protein
MDAMSSAQEQEVTYPNCYNRAETVTFLPAFARFSSETGENRVAKSRFSARARLARRA